jgi:hypothetical protein
MVAGRGTYKISRGGKQAWTFDLWTLDKFNGCEEIPCEKGANLLGFGAHASAQEEEREKGEGERGRRKKGCWTRLIRILCNASLRSISELQSRKESCLGGKWGKPCCIVPILER